MREREKERFESHSSSDPIVQLLSSDAVLICILIKRKTKIVYLNTSIIIEIFCKLF